MFWKKIFFLCELGLTFKWPLIGFMTVTKRKIHNIFLCIEWQLIYVIENILKTTTIFNLFDRIRIWKDETLNKKDLLHKRKQFYGKSNQFKDLSSDRFRIWVEGRNSFILARRTMPTIDTRFKTSKNREKLRKKDCKTFKTGFMIRAKFLI